MKFGRYLALMALSWVLAALFVTAFTLMVDAIGISPVRVAIAGFNKWKPLRDDHDWIVKRYDIRRSQPTTIFMGSSRIKQSMDPRLVAGTGFAPAYNGGLNGVANFTETKSYLQYYLQADKRLHYVFIEAFASALLIHRDRGATVRGDPRSGPPLDQPRNRPLVEFGLANNLADFVSVFFSMSGLSSATRTVSVNLRQRNLSNAGSADDGFAPVALAPHHFSVRNVFNFVLHTGFMGAAEVYSRPPWSRREK